MTAYSRYVVGVQFFSDRTITYQLLIFKLPESFFVKNTDF